MFRLVATHLGLLRGFVQDFPLTTLMGVVGESQSQVWGASLDWNRVYDTNDRAFKLWKAGRRHESIQAYRESIELADEQMHILTTLFHHQSAVLDYHAAVEAARGFIRLLPEHPDGYQLLGQALAELQRRNEAIEAWRAASERAPTDTAVQQGLGWALFGVGAWSDAIGALERALPNAHEANRRAIMRKLEEARVRAGTDDRGP
jgi:tetratricopeptide (TPR) repeat protein